MDRTKKYEKITIGSYYITKLCQGCGYLILYGSDVVKRKGEAYCVPCADRLNLKYSTFQEKNKGGFHE